MLRLFIGLLAAVLTSGNARAHFIWLIPAAKSDSAAAVFSDSPRLDGGEPLRINKNTTFTLRHAVSGRIEIVTGTAEKDVYRVACPGTGPRTVAVVKNRLSTLKGGQLITNVAIAHLSDPEQKAPNTEKAWEWAEIGLEIVPGLDKGPEVFQVLYRGKPVEKIDVEVYRPGDMDTDKVPVFTSDKEGLFTLKSPKPGRYGLLASKEFDETGMYDGKPFTTRSYTSSLVVEVPVPSAK